MQLYKHWFSLIIFSLATLVVGAFGALFQPDVWFDLLHKPALMPPNTVFAPVWTVLYIFITLAGWHFWCNTAGKIRSAGLFWYGFQLIINAFWTYLFFEQHYITFALLDIILLLFAIVMTFKHFYRSSSVAGYLLLPYLAWVLFATYLNIMFWWLN